MNLIDNWKAVATKAWSMRLVLLSALGPLWYFRKRGWLK